MGAFDNIGDKAKEALQQHGDKVDEGIDKAAELANEKTGGKYEDKIQSGRQAAHEGVDKLRGQQ